MYHYIVQYKVKILSADSSETSAVGPDESVLRTVTSTTSLQYIGCTPRRHRGLDIVGHIGNENKTDLQNVIQKVWTIANQGKNH